MHYTSVENGALGFPDKSAPTKPKWFIVILVDSVDRSSLRFLACDNRILPELFGGIYFLCFYIL
jgi:hypothetical protein